MLNFFKFKNTSGFRVFPQFRVKTAVNNEVRIEINNLLANFFIIYILYFISFYFIYPSSNNERRDGK